MAQLDCLTATTNAQRAIRLRSRPQESSTPLDSDLRGALPMGRLNLSGFDDLEDDAISGWVSCITPDGVYQDQDEVNPDRF